MMTKMGLAATSGVEAPAEHGVTAIPSHTHGECLNCAAKLQGAFCHGCGQSSDDHHRSIGHLLWEALEGLTHLDGRLAKTLPALLFYPGRLARDHVEGRRVRHVPPFRLFLVSLFIFMFAAEWSVTRSDDASVQLRDGTSGAAARSFSLGGTKVVVARAPDFAQVLKQSRGEHVPFEEWLKAHAGRAVQNRQLFMMLVFEWAHRLAILMLPILAALLALFYVNRRGFYVYDHLVVAMQYLSFCFLVWAVAWVMPDTKTSIWTFAAMIWTPVNLYFILRTAYGSSRVGAGLKTMALSFATLTTFACLLTGLLLFALSQI